MRTIQAPSLTELSDLMWTAEQLFNDLLNADLIIAASEVKGAVDDLRRRVREENEQ